MVIEATAEQVTEMAKLAILNSVPVGMGKLAYNPDLQLEDIHVSSGTHGISVDYYGGRMVKFHARRVDDNKWEVSDTTSEDYQSWKPKYGSYQALLDAVRKS